MNVDYNLIEFDGGAWVETDETAPYNQYLKFGDDDGVAIAFSVMEAEDIYRLLRERFGD